MKLFENILNQSIPEKLPIIPTMDVVAFPNMIIPLLIIDEKIINGIKNSINSGGKLVVIVACKKQTDPNKAIGTEDLYNIGTVASIIRMIPLAEEGSKVLIQGLCRVKLSDINMSDTLTANIEQIKYIKNNESIKLIEEKVTYIKSIIDELSKNGSINVDFSSIISKMNNVDKISDFILSHLTLSVEELQRLLEANSYSEFFDLSAEFLVRESELSKINQTIKNKARESISNAQKEFYIREQIKALKEEIGEEEVCINGFKKKLSDIKNYLIEESYKELSKTINRLETMQQESAEANVLRTYLEYVFDLPWNNETLDNEDIINAKMILDEEHYGLKNIKERILDFLSVRMLSKKVSSQILCFYGPPGTGKTSLAQSIAKSIGRKCIKIAVGGMKDEAEIRGHRRTYVGAIPGRFIKGLKQAQTKNPLIIIDEIDKIGQEFKGDPAAALLEVLDYQQNSNFYDYYLGIPFDLSNVFFVATANNIDNISSPLLDRMELIQLSSYSYDEKKSIANKYLLKKIIKESGLDSKNVNISEEIINKIITEYTYEAGVRDLERWLKKLCFRIARIYLETGNIPEISEESIEKYIGPSRFIKNVKTQVNKIGVSLGLCWTSCGGDVIYIESVILKGSGKLILTGKLGDVMKESAHTAISYIRSNFKKYSLTEELFINNDIHMHVPAGGIPKDGPSAGAAILISMLSALTKKQINHEYAMTGEIDLQGNMLPIGGIKEKIIAAKRLGLKIVFIPEKNKADVLESIEYFDGVEIIYVSKVEEIINSIFVERFIYDIIVKNDFETEKIYSEEIINLVESNKIAKNK